MAHRGDGDGFVHCADGQHRWGLFGAAGLLLRAPAPDGAPLVLVQHRAAWTHHGGCWGLPGGARTSTETAPAAALREAAEEAGIDGARVRVRGELVDRPGGDHWTYTTVVADAAEPLPVVPDEESDELRWIPDDEVAALPLHPALAATWPGLRAPPVPLLVDAANVVGSVPDGWWRDRAGAAERLLRRLAATLPATLAVGGGFRWVRDCTVVLEGAARAAPDVPGLRVVRAEGSGDDTIAALADPATLVVTADRGLRARLPGPAVGPTALAHL